jgi:hypothetical protein
LPNVDGLAGKKTIYVELHSAVCTCLEDRVKDTYAVSFTQVSKVEAGGGEIRGRIFRKGGCSRVNPSDALLRPMRDRNVRIFSAWCGGGTTGSRRQLRSLLKWQWSESSPRWIELSGALVAM